MNRVILIKYGELSTKKGNRSFFINTLYNNICSKLVNYDVKITKDRARMTILFKDEDLDNIKDKILFSISIDNTTFDDHLVYTK